MFSLSKKTVEDLENRTGLTYSQLRSFSLDEELSFFKKNGKQVSFSKERREGIIGRGNPLLARRRIRTMEDVDTFLEKIIYAV